MSSVHIDTVSRRLERAADADCRYLAELQIAVLLHEESPASLPGLLATAGRSDLAPIVIPVITAFGELWKVTTDDEIAAYTAAHRSHLDPLLLFELAHEGQPTAGMRRAAAVGGLDADFRRWVARLVQI